MLYLVVLLLISLVFGDPMCLRQTSHERGTPFDIQNVQDALSYWPFSCDGTCPCICPDPLPELVFSVRRKEDGRKLTLVFINEGTVPTTPTVATISWKSAVEDPKYYTGKSFAVYHEYRDEIPANVSLVVQALCFQDLHMIV